MKKDTKSSNLNDNLMDCNKNNLPKGSFKKISAVENNFLNKKQKDDSPLLKKSDPDKKRVEELSAKEQECRRKFKEKFNRLKKMPMPPQPTINVNSEGLTEGELSIENVKRKFKQIFSKFFKESLPSATPELEKTVEKKQANDLKVCVGTKPIDSAIYRFTCVLPMKRSASISKDIESMLCKSVDLLPEQYVTNEQIVLFSKSKQKTANACAPGASERDVVSPAKTNEKENPSNVTTTPENKVMETRKEKVKPLDTISEVKTAPTSIPAPAPAPALAPAPAPSLVPTPVLGPAPPYPCPSPFPSSFVPPMNTEQVVIPTKNKEKPLDPGLLAKPSTDPAPYDKPKPKPKPKPEEKSLGLMKKEKIVEPLKIEALREPMNKTSNSVRGGILSSILKNFAFDSKLFKPKSWFSGTSRATKMKMIPLTSMSKIPVRWRQGFVILGTFIPLYYTYHKIVTNSKLTLPITEKN